jgi:outer membrane receptor protein involved in Fe transport
MFGMRSIISPTKLNDFNVSFIREYGQQGQKADIPKTVVRGAFIGGPSSVDLTNRESTFDVQDIYTYTPGRHTFRFGGGYRFRRINAVDATNFVGTYFYQGLQDYIEHRPVEFRVFQGDPASTVSEHQLQGFIEDEIKVTRWLNVTPGVRYDWQSSLSDSNNFGGRLSFAMAPGTNKMVIRGGAGIFYERLQSSVLRQLFIDGASTKEVRILNPPFPDPFRSSNRRPEPKPSLWRMAPDAAAPYLIMASIGIERELWHRTHISVEYQRLHGVHLMRARNVNAPLDPEIFGFQYTGVRLNPDFSDIKQVESSASSRGSALKATFKGRLGKWFKGMAQYTYSSFTDDTGGPLVLPENNWDLRRELGRSNFDLRHRFTYAGTFDLPMAFRFGSVLSIASGRPFDIITGFDDNGDQNPYDRPLGGTRNTAVGPPIMQLDVRLTKLFHFPTFFEHKSENGIRKVKNFEVSFDAFNVFNHPNTPAIVGELGSQIFGQASTANMARTLQLSVKYSF